MTYNSMPFWANTEYELATEIKKPIDFTSEQCTRETSLELKSLIETFLEKDMKKRQSLKEILKHKFFQL